MVDEIRVAHCIISKHVSYDLTGDEENAKSLANDNSDVNSY